ATVVANGGSGPLDTAVSDSFTIGTPGSPTFVYPVPGANSIDVSWNAPSVTGAGIDHYMATASPGGLSCPTTSGSGDTACTITGLTNLVAYTVSVVAHGAGNSAASTPSDQVVPLPAAINLHAGSNSKWVTAEDAGASPLVARASTPGAWEKFDVVGNADGTI